MSAATGGARLPDLDQEMPDGLDVVQAGSEYRLGFRSAVRNVGDGPLIIDGHRAGIDHRTMVADQVVVRDGAPRARIRDVGPPALRRLARTTGTGTCCASSATSCAGRAAPCPS